MTTYILKTVLCSALLLAVYFLFLEREKMHRFNRFYLLFSIAFSFAIPFITVETGSSVLPVSEAISETVESYHNIIWQQTDVPIHDHNILPNILLVIYSTITAILLYRFIKNIAALFSTIKNNKSVSYFGATLVLTNNKLIPHSFSNYIFIDKDDFEKGTIEKEIIHHELTHVLQKHSIDILFIELLLIFAWFNPLLYWYRKAIQLNHEFLADDGVIKTFNDTPSYQHLLLHKGSRTSSLLLTSRLNYSITKKRLMMMTKITMPEVAIFKQIAIIPLAAATVFLFSTKVTAQDITNRDTTKITKPQQKKNDSKPPAWVGRLIGGTEEGVTEELLKEYQTIIYKNMTTNKKGWVEFQKNKTKEDIDRLETIFKQMSREQQAKQTVVFMLLPRPLPNVVPTEKQFESWKNPKIYGVWINDKKVSNSALNKYSNIDFAQVFVSKLYGAAKKNVNYSYQVDLMTKDYYQNHYDRTVANKKNMMMFRRHFSGKEGTK